MIPMLYNDPLISCFINNNDTVDEYRSVIPIAEGTSIEQDRNLLLVSLLIAIERLSNFESVARVILRKGLYLVLCPRINKKETVARLISDMKIECEEKAQSIANFCNEHELMKSDLYLCDLKRTHEKTGYVHQLNLVSINRSAFNSLEDIMTVTKNIYHNIANNQAIVIEQILNCTPMYHSYILDTYNDIKPTFPLGVNIYALLAEVCITYPNEIALENDTIHYTYRELISLINALTTVLMNHGIVKSKRIALLLPKSIDMIVLFITLITYGAVVIPIHYESDFRAVERIIDIAHPDIIISDQKHGILMQLKMEVLLLQELMSDICINQDNVYIKYEVDTTDTALILFTTGTTGNPKGIEITQQNIICSVYQNNYIHMNKNDKRLQLSNYIFDGFLFDVFSTLLSGACLFIIDNESKNKDPKFIAFTLIDKKITVVYFVTPLLNLLSEIEMECLSRLRRIYFGGDTASIMHIEKIFNTVGKGILCNIYGPTETVMMSTFFDVDDLDNLQYDVPIGNPIKNKSIFVVDNSRKILPAGVVGELLIGGYGVAKGYYGNDEITLQKFIINPYQCGRAYLSGDLAYFDEQHILHFVGRKDTEVKINGHRINSIEIEKAINSIAMIQDNVVLVIKEGNKKWLISYYISHGRLELKDLRDSVSALLPDYCIPNQFIRMDALPYTATGKVDKKKLISNFMVDRSTDAVEDILSTELSKKIAEIWNEILGSYPQSLDADFYEYGGDSLSLMKLLITINEHKLTIVDYENFKESPTFGCLICILQTSIDRDSNDTYMKTKHRSDTCYLLSKPQEKILTECLINRNKVKTSYNNVVIIDIIGTIDYTKLCGVVQKVFERHRILRSQIQLSENVFQIVVKDLDHLDIPHITRNDLHYEAIIDEFSEQFKLLNSFLFKVCLYSNVAKNQHFLVFDFHHVIFDGMSISILTNEIFMMYSQTTVAVLEYDFLDHIHQCHSVINLIDDEYWKGKNASLFDNDVCIFDSYQTFDFCGHRIKYQLNNSDSKVIKQNVTWNKCTQYIYMLACLSIALSEVYGKRDVLIGTVNWGRNCITDLNLIGMFIKIHPVMVSAIDTRSLRDIIGEVKKDCKHVDCNLNMKYEVFFQYQNLGVEIKKNDNVTFSPSHESMNRGVKYPLLIEVVEESGCIILNVEYSPHYLNQSDIDVFVAKYTSIMKLSEWK